MGMKAKRGAAATCRGSRRQDPEANALNTDFLDNDGLRVPYLILPVLGPTAPHRTSKGVMAWRMAPEAGS
jgi:hypothetical protein